MSPSLQRAALSIDALVDHVPSPPRTRQCGKCQEAHTRCDGRDPCRSCEVRGTLCGYAWSSFSAPPPVPALAPVPVHHHQHPPPAPPVHRAPGYAQHVLYFPPPAKRGVRQGDPPLGRAPPADGGWALVPAGTNAPAVTRGGEPGPPIKPCKTCQARNTTCDGVVPVCGSCRTRRLECYIATPAAPERPRVQSLRPMSVRDKPPRGFPLSMAQAAPPPPHPARSRALSSNEDGKPSRASLSFMLNPTPTAEQPVASTSRAPPPRPSELKRPPPAPTALVTPPTPVAPNGLEQAQSRMDVDSPLLEPRSASPLSPSSSTTGGGADLSRRPSRKRSASPSSYGERWGSSSPSRESVSSESYARPSMESRSVRASMDSHSARPSVDSHSARPKDSHSNRLSMESRHSNDSYHPHPVDEERERRRSKSSLSHLLDGDGQGGINRQIAPAPAPAPRPTSSSSSRPNSKRGSISTALAGMQLKSATTSRASSPGSTAGRERAHAWPTFSTVGESMGPDVWRNETEADMRRREHEAEERKKARQARGIDVEMEPEPVELQRRRSEGPKRRRIEEDVGVEPGVSIVEQIRRASGEVSRRTSGDDTPTRRASGDDVPSRRSTTDDALSRRSTMDDAHTPRILTDDAHTRRSLTGDSHAKRTSTDGRDRRGSVQVPGAWQEPAIVVSDSPESQSNDQMVLEADEPKDVLISSPVEAVPSANGVSVEGSGDGSSKTVVSKAISGDSPIKNGITDVPRKNSVAEIKRSPSSDGRNGSTPPVGNAFQHIWPPPVIETKKGRKSKAEPEPAPSRSFITQRNLSIAPTSASVPPEEDTKDNRDAGSSLRTMLTTMPPRAVFMSSVQTFLAQPKKKGRAVVMTKALMKDALGVLLDPATDELLKDYVQPERGGVLGLERSGSQSKLERSGSQSKLERSGSQSKLERSGSQPRSGSDDRSSRDGTPAQGRKTIDASDHTTLEFRAWAKRMFSTVKTPRGEDVLAFGGKPVTVEDDIYETIVLCHSKGNHCGAEETVRLVDQAHSWVPRMLVEAFVQECPGCPASNKTTSTTAKPKKRKWVRKDDKPPAATKRKPATGRRGKGGKRKKAVDESEEEQEQEQEVEEQEQEMEEDELGEEVEEEEMESEDETIARPATTKMDVDDA